MREANSENYNIFVNFSFHPGSEVALDHAYIDGELDWNLRLRIWYQSLLIALLCSIF